MRKIFFLLLPIGILFCSFKMVSKKTKKTSSEISATNDLTGQRLLERVKIIKQFIGNNPKFNKELAFFIDM